MSSVYFSCGCGITKSMFGDRSVLSVSHCEIHSHLFSQDKTLRCMADELYALQLETV